LEGLENRTVLSSVTWINAAGGDWGTAANWSDNALPNASEDAVINIATSSPITISSGDPVAAHSLTDTTASLDITGGSLSLGAASSVSQTVIMSGGVLTGSGTLTVKGLLTWTGGTMSGPGTTIAAGGLQLGANDGNSYTEKLAARTLQNAGAATWASTDTLDQTAGAVFENLANATLSVQSGVTWNSSNGTLDNQSKGTLTVAAGTGGTATFDGYFQNEGNLEVSSGTLVLQANGSVTGNTKVDSGATLQFAGSGYAFDGGAGVTGTGTVTFGASSATIFHTGTSYSFSGVTDIQDSATVIFDATASTHDLNESGGNLGGSGTFTVGSGTTTWTGGTMSGAGITQCLGPLSLGASGDTGDSETLVGRMLINDVSGIWYGSDTLYQEENSTFLNYSNATLIINGGGSWAAYTGALDPSATFENNGSVTVADGSGTSLVAPYFINSGTVEVASGTLQLGGGGVCPWNALAVKAGFTVDSGATLVFGNNNNYEPYTFNSGGYISGAGSVAFGSGMSVNFAKGSTYNPSGETLIDTGGSSGAGVVFAAESTVGSLGNLTVHTGTVNFSTGATITVASLSLITGEAVLSGSDTLGVTGLLTWTDGRMVGPGTTVASGGIALGATDGAAHDPTFEARTLLNEAVATWVGLGTIDLLAGSTFTNEVHATFNDEANGVIESDGSGSIASSVFDNEGTFVVDVGSTTTGTASMGANFNNEGQVQIASGTWILTGAGAAAGDFIMNAGTFLQLNRMYGIPSTVDKDGNFVSSPQIIGGSGANVTFNGDNPLPTPLGGITEIDGGAYEVAGGGTDTIASLDMTGGYLTIFGTLTVKGAMTWTGGSIAGPGTLNVQGGLTLGTAGGATGEVLYGVTLNNSSSITVAAGNAFSQQYGATVENGILSTIDFDGDSTWSGDSTGTINNQGTIKKTAGTGTATINDLTLVNDGAVTLTSGTLDLETGGTATGSFSAAAQTTLEFGHSSFAFNSTSSVTGAGTVEFPFAYWPSVFNSNCTYNVMGATQIDSQAPLDFTDGSHVQNLGAVSLVSGTLDLSSGSAVSAASLTESGGAILTGSDPLTVSRNITWTGGVMSGTGSTVVDGALQMGASGDPNDVEDLAVRTLVLTGGGTLEPLDTLQQSYGSTFVNAAGDTLDVDGGVKWQSAEDGTATIVNQGAIVVGAIIGNVLTPAAITGPGGFPFLTCPGAIGVDIGTLDVGCGGLATGTLPASFTVATGCTLEFDGDFTLEAGAGIGGPGTVDVSSGELWFTSSAFSNFVGTMNVDGGTVRYDDAASAGTLNLSSGDLTGSGTLTVTGPTAWTGGTMDGAGNTITEGGLQIGLPSDMNDDETQGGRTLTNAGAATWAGGGGFSQMDGATFVNQPKASFNIENGLTWASNDGTGVIANAGTLEEAASGATTTLQAALDNTGSVRVEQGTLSLQSGGVVGGSYLVLAGATLTFGNDNVTTTSIAVPGDFTNGPLSWSATYSGTATDNSGSGLASVGASLFDGTNYYNGSAFQSPTPVFNAATLSGSSWTYTIEASNFQGDVPYAASSAATDKHGGSEPSTITSVLLAPAPPVVTAVTPVVGPTAGGTTVTITGSALANATAVYFGTLLATIVRDTSTSIVATSPATTVAGSVPVTVTTAGGTSATSSADLFTYGVPPTSKVAALPASTTKTSFTVSWAGSDGTGTGIASYSVYVSDNGGAYKPFVSDTTKTSAVFTGQVNHSYAFYSVATDRLGLSQPTPTTAQATTKIVLPPPVTLKQVRDITNKKHQVTEVMLTFSGGVNSTEADLITTYHLATPGKGGSYTAKNAGVINLRSAVYSGAAFTVALTPASPFALTKPVELVVYGTGRKGLKDIYGRLIDGAGKGVAGSNAVVILSNGGVKIEAIAVHRQASPATRRAAVDAALASGDLAALRSL
jgi:hypothetical protein